MTAREITVEGRCFDGQQPIAVPAVLVFSGREALLTASQITERYDILQMTVSPRSGRSDRFIVMPDGRQFQCGDDPFLDSLPQESRSGGLVARLEERWSIALAGVAIIVSIVLAGYFYGLPAAAERIAARIPVKTERIIGEQALTWLDSNEWFRPSHLEGKERERIRKGFEELIRDLPMKNHYRLEFRDAGVIGPNAFALPGGTIVITDDMVKEAESLEEVLAVLAHEIGHVELRHTMRSILQSSAVAAVAATITADAASLSVAVAGLPAMLAQTKYSRGFEIEADEYAFRLLKQRGHSPAAFATFMERLGKNRKEEERDLSFISTHPVTAERVDRARTAAAE